MSKKSETDPALARLNAVWPALPERTRAVILVAAGLLDATPRDADGELSKLAQRWRRAARGRNSSAC